MLADLPALPGMASSGGGEPDQQNNSMALPSLPNANVDLMQQQQQLQQQQQQQQADVIVPVGINIRVRLASPPSSEGDKNMVEEAAAEECGAPKTGGGFSTTITIPIDCDWNEFTGRVAAALGLGGRERIGRILRGAGTDREEELDLHGAVKPLNKAANEGGKG